MASAAAAVQNIATPAVDLEALKARQQGAWSSGDYAVVGTTLQIVGEELCEALDIRSGQKVVLHYTSWEQITDDIDDARIYGGVHFRFDQSAGARLGRQVGTYVLQNMLRPVSGQ